MVAEIVPSCLRNGQEIFSSERKLPSAHSLCVRNDPADAAVNSGPSTEDAVSPPAEINCTSAQEEKSRRRVRRKSAVHFAAFDISSEEELDIENLAQFSARWDPKEACRPIVDEAPVFYPSEEEFKDALGYIASIRLKAEKYGICRIVPPASWTPPCPLKEKGRWDGIKFTTRVQPVDKLQNREPVKKKRKNRVCRKRKRRKRLRFGMTRRRTPSVASEADNCGSDSEEKFGFQNGTDFTLESFQLFANIFKDLYFKMEGGNKHLSETTEPTTTQAPSVEDIEGEYWRIVENNADEVEVHYGADLETSTFSSGFPIASHSSANQPDPYASSAWNLNNLPRLPGSVLSFEKVDISGVLVPWLYIGMCFSSFCWHVEDHHLYSLNYLHFGDPKLWYGVPGSDAVKLEAAMKKHLPELFKEQPHLLHELVTQLSPSVLKCEGVPVYRAVQNAGEFLITFPRAYHSGFNCGFNCAEAVNVAPIDWLPHGQSAIELYSAQSRKTSVSHDKLLLGAADAAVRSLCEISNHDRSSPDSMRWINGCGKNGALTMAVKERVKLEKERRDNLVVGIETKKMDVDFDSSDERECAFCFYDLHLSAAGCSCSSDRFTCLRHEELLCSCDLSKKFYLFRYSISDLNTLLEALEGNIDALRKWGSEKLGLLLHSKEVNSGPKDMGCEPRVDTMVEGTIMSHKCLDTPVLCPTVGRKRTDSKAFEEDSLNVNKHSLQNDCKLDIDESDGKGNGCMADLFIVEKSENADVAPRAVDVEGSARIYSQLKVEEPCLESDGGQVHEVVHGIGQPLMKVSDINTLVVTEKAGQNTYAFHNFLNLSPQKIDVQEKDNVSTSYPLSHSSDHLGKISKSNAVTSSSNPQKIGGFRDSSCSENLKSFDISSRSMPFGCDPQEPRSSWHVELLDLGTLAPGSMWCSKQSIFPKGYKSRTKFVSVLDPMSMDSYISEIMDSGIIGPLFKVSLEARPDISFTGSSPSECWEMVQKRIYEMARSGSTLQIHLPIFNSDFMSGLGMFGFLSPHIVQATEALDPDHQCTTYWSARSDQNVRLEGTDLNNFPLKDFDAEARTHLCNNQSNKLFGMDLCSWMSHDSDSSLCTNSDNSLCPGSKQQ